VLYNTILLLKNIALAKESIGYIVSSIAKNTVTSNK